MDKINLTTILAGSNANISLSIRKVENGIIISYYTGTSSKEYVFQGTAEQVFDKIQETIPEIADLFESGVTV